MVKLVLAVLILVAGLGGAWAAKTRCGWLVNPTPGNWWLTDRDGDWVLMTQGQEARDAVMDNLPEFDQSQYVATNGYYGYGCACLSVDLDAAGETIVRVHSGKTIPLARCRNDPSLPPME